MGISLLLLLKEYFSSDNNHPITLSICFFFIFFFQFIYLFICLFILGKNESWKVCFWLGNSVLKFNLGLLKKNCYTSKEKLQVKECFNSFQERSIFFLKKNKSYLDTNQIYQLLLCWYILMLILIRQSLTGLCCRMIPKLQ